MYKKSCRFFAIPSPTSLNDMKLLVVIAIFLFGYTLSIAQPISIQDTVVYEVAETLPFPLLKNCMLENHPGWTVDSARSCSEMQLLGLLASNMRYPEEARQQNIQGTVVLSFVVEPANGRISNIGLLKDIGGGCGAEAIRVLKALNEAGLRWAPATRAGAQVRLRHSIPVRFKLQEALPYYVSEQGDSIYIDYASGPSYKPGMDSLITYVLNRLVYPKTWKDSCKTGIIEMALLIRKDGAVNVENTLDFNNLGLDFQWEALRLANRTSGSWQPAIYGGQPVMSTTPLRVVFKSDAPGCKTANGNFDRAMILADEGSMLLTAEKPMEAIAKWTEALALQPNNCELLYYRGTALLNENHREEACEDYSRVKDIMGVTWFEEIRRLVCGW